MRTVGTRSARTIALLVCAAAVAHGASKPARQGMADRVGAAVAKFPGTVYLFAKNLDTGEEFAIRADDRIRTASTIKVPVMTAVFAAVESGDAKWSDELVLKDADKVGGSGVLQEMSDGLRLPLRDLVRLMIVVSDNTATNLLLER